MNLTHFFPLLPICILSFACLDQPATRASAPYPLNEVVFLRSGDIYIYTDEEVELADLIDMTPFLELEFWPGISADEATALQGPPAVIGTTRRGRDKVYGYTSTLGTVEIVEQHVSSEGTEAVRWFLRLHLKPEIDESALIDKSILTYRPSGCTGRERTIIFSGKDHESAVALEFADRELTYLWWQG